jgi:Cadherin C-terminal cytoplasmic tail, catenin-binding region
VPDSELSVSDIFHDGLSEKDCMLNASRIGRGNPGVRGEDHSGQVTKGVWGMSWRQKAMKGVEGCEKPGEAVKQALIPGSPNVVRGIHMRTRQTR